MRKNVFLSCTNSATEIYLSHSILHCPHRYGNIPGLSTADCAGKCDPGDYCPVGTLNPGPCPAGFSCPDSSKEPTECPDGEISAKGSTECEACTVGFRAHEKTACELCPVGTWAARSTSAACSACPGGRYGDELYLGSDDDCKPVCLQIVAPAPIHYMKNFMCF